MFTRQCIVVVGLVAAQVGTAGANEQPADATPPDPPVVARPSRAASAQPPQTSSAMPAPAAAPAPTVATTDVQAPVTAEIDTRWRVDAMLGLGSDNLNVGFGARFGKTLDNHVYIGGLAVYHVGETVTTTGGSASEHALYIGPEVGYEISLDRYLPMTIRPYLGIGMATAWGTSSASTTGMSTSASQSQFAIWPGVAAYHRFTDTNYMLGGDLRVVTVPDGSSFGLFVIAGTYFGS